MARETIQDDASRLLCAVKGTQRAELRSAFSCLDKASLRAVYGASYSFYRAKISLFEGYNVELRKKISRLDDTITLAERMVETYETNNSAAGYRQIHTAIALGALKAFEEYSRSNPDPAGKKTEIFQNI